MGDEDLLETNGLVSTKLFDVTQTTTIAPRSDVTLTDDTREYLNHNLYSRDPINITHNLNRPWPVRDHKNNKPIISNTVGDVTEDNYFKYNKKYISIDSEKSTYSVDTSIFDFNYGLKNNSEINYQRYVLVDNARYIINLNKPYNDIYKIKLVDFAIYDLSLEYTPADSSETEPIKYTPYVIIRVQPIATKEVETESNFEVATSETNSDIQEKGKPVTTPYGQLLTYSKYEVYSTVLSKVRFYKVTANSLVESLSFDDFMEPIYSDTEMIYKNPIQNVSRLLITIYDANGNIYRSMQKHHFTLEVTEKINVLKNTNLNTRDGEVDISGVAKSNPLLFSN